MTPRSRSRSRRARPTARSSRARARCTRPSIGPVFTSLLGPAAVPVDAGVGATRWATRTRSNFRLLNHFFEVNQAQSTAQLDAIERRYQGIPWVNTIAADSSGSAYYADIGTVPHVTDEEVGALQHDRARHRDVPRARAAGARRLALGVPLGQRPRRASRPGSSGPARMPSLFRDDYVTNSNDSYWLSNPAQPLEGFARIIGDERTERSLRTRHRAADRGRPAREGAVHPADAPGRGVHQPPARRRADARRRSSALCEAATWRDGRARRCDGLGPAREPRLARARCCSAASSSRLLARAPPPAGIWRTPFDADDPVNTPRGLNTDDPRVQRGAARRGRRPQRAGMALDVDAARRAVRERGEREDPDPRRPGRPGGRLQRDQRRRGCRARATRTSRTARAS